MKDHRYGQGYSLPAELGMVRGVLRTPRLVGGAIVTEGGTLASEDFEAGSTGWEIAGDGSVEFNDGVFRGTLEANEIDAGVITLGPGSSIESEDFDTGVAGWQIAGAGTAEFNDVAIRGTILTGDTGDIQVEVTTSSGAGLILFRTADVDETATGILYVEVVGSDPARYPDLQMASPTLDGGAESRLELRGESPDNTVGASAVLSAGPVTNPSTSGHDVLLNAADDIGLLAVDLITCDPGGRFQVRAGTDVFLQAETDISLLANGGRILMVTESGSGENIDLQADGAITFTAAELGFFGVTPVAKPTGVSVDAAGIHAALTSLGLIS